MRVGWILPVMAVLLCGCGRRQTVRTPKAVPVREDGAIALRLVTFNLRYENEGDRGPRNWHERVIASVRSLTRMSPDVFAVQEALHGQVADLRASLPDYDFTGVGRDDGRREGEYTGIFYRADRFVKDTSDAGTFWLSDTPEIPGSKTWGNEIPRIACWTRLTDRATDRSFYVFATHWDHRNQPSRERAARLIAQRIDSRRHADEPVVLLGDFNAVEGNPAVTYLLGQGGWKNGLVDAFDSRHRGEGNRTTLHFWEGKRAGTRNVDHILVSKGARVLDADIVVDPEPLPSDHFPVSARVEFPRP
ncbi:endonuclease/exonuclease/phosphatase family protein [Luteolibacter sp. LG18]|uniref:endonuclease/exonuclease/phosphatase family protein n=1 Tax=Luteolibacter sp. LG18 TaxID=2819286 RepID=UPI002B2F8EF7|nr:endonuclease [Luteolibacter sp. LG18]